VRTGRVRTASGARAIAAPGSPVKRELRGAYRLIRWAFRTRQLLRAARAIRGVDVVHANDLDTLPAGLALARRLGARLVYDAHEIYSEFDQHPPRAQRTVALAIERALARRADAVVTVSDALADELQRRLGLQARPFVVHNAPPLGPDPGHGDGRPLRAVYQGGFGPGRPIGDLIDAARALPEVQFTIRPIQDVEALMPPNVTLEPPVPPGDVVAALGGHDVGVVFDRPLSRNSELAMPNKLFEYLMGGLAIAASDLPALGAFVREHEVGVVFRPGCLADGLRELAADPGRLDAMRVRARALAVGRFNAEAQRAALLAAWDGT
jgi:glycogen(starch) synthase